MELRKLMATGVVLSFAALCVLDGCQKKAVAGPITVYAATGGMPRPFTYVDEQNKLVGHNIELAEAVFARLPQYTLSFEITDFPSIFAGLDADRYQIGVNNFAINEERKQKYDFSLPMFKNRYVAAVAENNLSLGSEVRVLADLAGKSTHNSVGTNMATAIENYNKAYPNAQIRQDYGDVNILVELQMVESGQYDFLLIDKPMYEYYVRDFGLKLRALELGTDVSDDLMQTPYSYLIISKGNDKLVEDINAALREVVASGESRRICEKYFGSDYSPEL